MKAVFALAAALFFIQIPTKSQAAEPNCRWDALHTGHNVHAGSQYLSFKACSIFIRGTILGASKESMGAYAQLAVGAETEGTLTFVERDGSKRVCQTKLRKPDASRLDRNEYLTAYLHAEMTGTALPPDQHDQATQILKRLNADPEAVVRKIDESMVLECLDSVS